MANIQPVEKPKKIPPSGSAGAGTGAAPPRKKERVMDRRIRQAWLDRREK